MLLRVLLLLVMVLLLLGVLLFRLGLLLRLLLLLGLILLFVLRLLLCVGRNGDPENQRQYSRTNDYDLFHATYLDLHLLSAACSSASILLSIFTGSSDGFTETASSARRFPCAFRGAKKDRCQMG